jgi:hypothetical protein
MKVPEFKEQYSAARRTCLDEAIDKLQELSNLAVDELRKIIFGRNKAGDKIAAIKVVLDNAHKGLEFRDMAFQVAEMMKYKKEKQGVVINVPSSVPPGNGAGVACLPPAVVHGGGGAGAGNGQRQPGPGEVPPGSVGPVHGGGLRPGPLAEEGDPFFHPPDTDALQPPGG